MTDAMFGYGGVFIRKTCVHRLAGRLDGVYVMSARSVLYFAINNSIDVM